MLQRVQVLNAQTDLIFGGYKIVRTSEYLGATPNSDGSWSMDEPFEEGDYYEVLSEIPQPTRAQLRGAGTDYPSTVEEKFLQLPEDTPPVVRETAQKIQRRYEPATPYDRARAIEQYLIYDGGFTYNLDVSYRRADKAVEEFLGESKEGFCTQFSTSMALILRDMNVPSRVVYGSTSGEEVGQGEYLVRGSNMHTWVEAYFPGVGWYPFNPTPGFSMPDAMEANAPRPELPLASGIQAAENSQDRSQLAQNRAQQQSREQNQDQADQGPTTGRSGENTYSCVASVRARAPSDRGGRTGLQEGAPRPRQARGPLQGPHRQAARRAAAEQEHRGRLARADPHRAGTAPRRGRRRGGGPDAPVRPGLLGSPLLRERWKRTTWPPLTGTPCKPTSACRAGEGRSEP